jgi:hypothetical protein
VDPKDDVDPLIPVALFGLSELLDIPMEKLPAGVTGLLQNFGIACHSMGWESAHNEPTIPGSYPLPKGIVGQ